MESIKKTHRNIWKRVLVYCLLFALTFGNCATGGFLLGTTTVEAAAKKVALSATSVKLCVGQKKTLSVKNTTDKVTWSVDKPKIATVSKKGKVTAVKTGTAKIKAVIGKKTLTCTVKVVKHTYKAATCTEPATCSRCKKTKGEPLGHLANEATCTEDSVCSRCEQLIEAAKGHDWTAASCTEPAICSRCGETQGEPVGHDFQPGKCGEPEACSRCGETRGEPIGHDFQPGKCGEPEVCSRCGEKSDKITEHVRSENHNPCTEDTICQRCHVVLEPARGHDYVETVIPPSVDGDGYTEAVCRICGDTKTYDFISYEITEASVRAALLAQQSVYPEGTPWGDEKVYVWQALPGYQVSAIACAAFVFMMSDIAFGTKRPATVITDLSDIESRIRIGDILRVDNDTHSVIVIDYDAEGVTVAEGNYNSSVHWGRKITYAELREGNAFYYTRY